VVLVTLVLLTATSPPAAAQIPVTAEGSRPAVAVDDRGAGHVAWHDANDVDVGYCRLDRGATACAATKRLPGPGGALRSFHSTVVLASGDRVIVLAELCCGKDDGVWQWTSVDRGTSFAPPVHISDEVDLHRGILGPGPFSVSVTGSVTTFGVAYATAALDGSTADVEAIRLGAGIGSDLSACGLNGTVALRDATTPVFGCNTLEGGAARVHLRRFDTSGGASYHDLARWSAPVAAPGDREEPILAGGPSGLWLQTRDRAAPFGALRVGPVGDGLAIGAEHLLGQGERPIFSDFAQGADGGLSSVWVANRNGNEVRHASSPNGAAWSVAVTIGKDPAHFNLRSGIAADGGGWVVADTNPSAKPVVAYPIPPRSAGGAPGGGADGNCRATVKLGARVTAVARGGACFTMKGKIATTNGAVRVNGSTSCRPGRRRRGSRAPAARRPRRPAGSPASPRSGSTRCPTPARR